MKSLFRIGLTSLTMLLSASAFAEDRSVALVLDASGSMNGRLHDGTQKIVAAKSSVRELVERLPDTVRLSLRAYGHQSHRSKHNCKDTQVLVPFDATSNVRDSVVGKSDGLTAQGYTPITYVLGLAADDLKTEADERVIVLVSDGKETCEGDPCLLARKLAEADAKLTIHTVGFGVDAQARMQLQCIAEAARGNFYDANTAPELAETMIEASQAKIEPAAEEETIKLTLPEKQEGTLEIIEPYFNSVVDAETGEEVGMTAAVNASFTLPTGIYNIKFGKNLWLKSVAVKTGETTVVHPGQLVIENAKSHKIMDPETGEVLDEISNVRNKAPLVAGLYDVSFGKAVWRGVEIAEGKPTVLTPGVLGVKGASGRYTVIDEVSGEAVEEISQFSSRKPLPTGSYTVMFGKAAWTGLELGEGQELILVPGKIEIKGMKSNDVARVFDEKGNEVLSLRSTRRSGLLPPGSYRLEIRGQSVDLSLSEGKKLVLDLS